MNLFSADRLAVAKEDDVFTCSERMLVCDGTLWGWRPVSAGNYSVTVQFSLASFAR
jgi:hypothetical protein